MKKRLVLSTHTMIERLLFINKRILSGMYPNSTELAEELEVSIATIGRDIEFLRCRLNAPVIYDRHKRGYVYKEAYNLTENLC